MQRSYLHVLHTAIYIRFIQMHLPCLKTVKITILLSFLSSRKSINKPWHKVTFGQHALHSIKWITIKLKCFIPTLSLIITTKGSNFIKTCHKQPGEKFNNKEIFTKEKSMTILRTYFCLNIWFNYTNLSANSATDNWQREQSILLLILWISCHRNSAT